MTILIERFGTPLKDWDIKINRGILTGCNEAFIINEQTRTKLISEDPKSAEIIRPILRGRDIKKDGYEFAGLYLIITHNGYKKEDGTVVPRIKIENYPSIKQWLESEDWNDKPNKGASIKRLQNRTDKGDTLYNLRDCAYMDDFNKQKICYSETNSSSLTKIALDKDGYMTDKTCFIITAADNFDIDILYKIMSSEIFTWYMNLLSPKLGDKGISLTKDTVKLFPASKRSENGVQESYSLTDEEMNFISSSVSKKN